MMPTRIAKRCLIAFVGVSAVTLALAQAESSDPRRVPPRQSRFQQPPADRAPAATGAAGDAPLPNRTDGGKPGGRKPTTPGLQMPATWEGAPLDSTANEPPLPKSRVSPSIPSAAADTPLPASPTKVKPAPQRPEPAAVAQSPTPARPRIEPTAKPATKVSSKAPLQVVTESPTSTFGVRRPADKRPASKAARSKTNPPVIEVAALRAETAPLVVTPAPQVAPAPLVIAPASDPARSDEVALEAPLPSPLVVRPQVAAAPKPAATKPASQTTAVAATRPEIVKQPTLAPPAPQAVVSKPAATPMPQPAVAARQSEPTSIVVTKPATPAIVVAEAPLIVPQPSPAPVSRPAPIAQVKPTPGLVVSPAVTPFVEVPTPTVAAAPAPVAPSPHAAPAQVAVTKPAPTVPKSPAPPVVASNKPATRPMIIETPEPTTVAVAHKPSAVVEEALPARPPVVATQPTVAAAPATVASATPAAPVRTATPAPAAVATAAEPAAAPPAPVASPPARKPLAQPTEVAAAPRATPRPAGPPQVASTQRMPVRPGLVLPAPLAQSQAREQRVSSAEMNAVARLADARIRRGFELGSRGALYSSRSEFMHALGMIAQALDAEAGSAIHMPAMTAGLQAIEESDDFVAHNAQPRADFDPVEVAARHRTPVLKGMERGSISGIEALQRYYSYAQERLAFAVGHQPVGAMALHGLGKLHTALARGQASQTVAAEPKALVFHQAALLVCPWNYMAANELGVLLVSYGRYEQAKAAFHQSLSISRQPTTWRNLAVAHQSSGETQLANLALQEAEYAAAELKRQTGGTGLASTAPVEFVDVETFRKTGEGPGLSPLSPTTMSAAPPSTTRKASMETVAPAMRQ